MEGRREFPHEIGLLLGYPAADVEGFIENKGQDSLYSGYWKVYDDVEHAKRLFDAYNKCRDRLLKAVAEGVPLHLAAASFLRRVLLWKRFLLFIGLVPVIRN